ncbi:urease accessory protein ureE [Rubidibacter lacunae KORDI 51-2]|uniref:Urease accessory protein UreE n=1 Tax=Rubidibacter lacunae KORDI 51-2 TaxID=582515 RepID=U5DFC0_9CHRO|nr:urease accessory protein UreE [Rubidibacter lacunae]ERN40301.1 urease accessory protein ureE [Rubidibacter lacunae KORDI 51-2]
MIAPNTLTFVRYLPPNERASVDLTLPLAAEERTRSRQQHQLPDGRFLRLHLPRGTVLKDGDLLQAETGEVLRAIAKPEPVLTATAPHALDLLRAVYHLGNRHVPLEITTDYLRLSPDPVLQSLLIQLGLEVCEETLPFRPEPGAYATH